MRRDIVCGDSADVLKGEPDASFDSCVTDPPYALTENTGQKFPGRYEANAQCSKGGFMGLAWDSELPTIDLWREVFRVLKPGAHLLAFGGTRTCHRLACTIEDAGFEIRDTLGWVYLSGFPKGHDVSKAMDKRKDWTALRSLQEKIKVARTAMGISQSEAARRCGLIGEGESLGGGGFMWYETGMRTPTREQYPRVKAALALDDSCDAAFEAAEREVVAKHRVRSPGNNMRVSKSNHERDEIGDITAPATDLAKAWDGWDVALKPCWEPIILARKPLDGTIAECVAKWGTGAMNIDGCRIPYASEADRGAQARVVGFRNAEKFRTVYSPFAGDPAYLEAAAEGHDIGRWPPNIIAAPGCFAANEQRVFDLGAWFAREEARYNQANPYHRGVLSGLWPCPKPDTAEKEAGLDGFEAKKTGAREDASWNADNPRAMGGATPRRNAHPTVKPVALMRWLARLVTPKGGIILEPFAGSGTTCCAAVAEQMGYLAIDREAEYVEIAKARAANALHEWDGVPLAPRKDGKPQQASAF